MESIKVTYEFYFNEYCLGAKPDIERDEFPKFIELAKRILSGFGVRADTVYVREISLCLCRVAEMLFKENCRGGIKNETTDGYSVSFDEGNPDKEIYRAVRSELSHLGLLYAGVSYEN